MCLSFIVRSKNIFFIYSFAYVAVDATSNQCERTQLAVHNVIMHPTYTALKYPNNLELQAKLGPQTSAILPSLWQHTANCLYLNVNSSAFVVYGWNLCESFVVRNRFREKYLGLTNFKYLGCFRIQNILILTTVESDFFKFCSTIINSIVCMCLYICQYTDKI